MESTLKISERMLEKNYRNAVKTVEMFHGFLNGKELPDAIFIRRKAH